MTAPVPTSPLRVAPVRVRHEATQTSLLVRTPAQCEGESTWGYVLRLTACNGYHRPTVIFKLARMSSADFQGVKLDCTKLKSVLGENGSALRPYMSTKNGTVTLMNSGVVWTTDLVAGAGRVCVECINEVGYLPAWTDLRMIDACPKHKKLLLTECLGCGGKLIWKRPSLLRCSCGEFLTNNACADASEEHCALITDLVSMVQIGGVTGDGPFWQAFPALTLSRFLGICAPWPAFTGASSAKHP